MDDWRPATIEKVTDIVRRDLRSCDAEQGAVFEKYAVTPYLAPILRYGKTENLVVVARNGSEVIYWEDLEEGFNVSPVDADGRILEHWCNHEELRFALNAWIKGRGLPGRFWPAVPLK